MERDDAIIEKFISLLPKYDLEFHSWDNGKEHAFQWRGGTYPTITDKDKIVKVALDRTDIFVRDNDVWVGDSSRPMLNGYVIQAIVTDPAHRGKGKAGEILRRIVKCADEAGLLLKLEAVPMKDFIKKKQSSMTKPQLIKWYSKHGFEKHPEASLMTRAPKSLTEVNNNLPSDGSGDYIGVVTTNNGEVRGWRTDNALKDNHLNHNVAGEWNKWRYVSKAIKQFPFQFTFPKGALIWTATPEKEASHAAENYISRRGGKVSGNFELHTGKRIFTEDMYQ